MGSAFNVTSDNTAKSIKGFNRPQIQCLPDLFPLCVNCMLVAILGKWRAYHDDTR